MMYIPLTLNKKGEAHLRRELRALGIIDMNSHYNRDKILWDIDATIEDITHQNSFQEMKKGTGSYFDYEISMYQLGKSGYGAKHINFTEEHIRWEKFDDI